MSVRRLCQCGDGGPPSGQLSASQNTSDCPRQTQVSDETAGADSNDKLHLRKRIGNQEVWEYLWWSVLQLSRALQSHWNRYLLLRVRADIYQSLLDKHLLPQIREKKFLISTPPDLVNRSSTFSRCAINEFLKYFLPSLSEGSCDAISRNVNLTVQGIYICAFSAFNCQTLLEQYRKSAIISSDKFWTHYKELFPDIENLSPVPLQVSPTTADSR